MKKLLFYAVILLFAVEVFAGNGEIRRARRPVPNQYIVVLEEGAGAPNVPTIAAEIARENGGNLRLVFRNVFEGFSVEMTEARAQAMSRDPRVLFVEENEYLEASVTQTLPADNSLWNLDRIDQLDPTPNSPPDQKLFNYATTGAGVTAYVIDTGVMAAHQEFATTRNMAPATRVVRGYDAVPGDGTTASNPCNSAFTGPTYIVNCSHGTSVASVLGGKDVGVAKAVTIVPIRVLRFISSGGPSTTTNTGRAEDLIEGIDYGVLPDHAWYPGPAVANMSVSSTLSSVEMAVNRMIDADITVVAAAGNQDSDACTVFTTSRLAYGNGGRVISVGGSMLIDGRDSRWVGNIPAGEMCQEPGSNHGRCVDIFAPAHQIKSALGTNSTGYRSQCKSGTSFASPLVAGVAALHLQNVTTAKPADVWNAIRANATPGRLAGGTYSLSPDPANPSPDRLLYSNWFTHSPSYEGYLDVANCRTIHGWAWDRNQPNSPINVEIYAGTGASTTRLQTLWANSYRADLVSAGKGDGEHGYGFGPPPSVKDGKLHSITAKYAGTDTNLFGTPKSLICGARIFSNTPPPTENVLTGGLYTVGTQFSSNRSGYITELGFYRAPNETGSNILKLWTDSGAEITTKTASCTSTGWCWVDIPDVAISAGTRYRVSVTVNNDHSKTGCGIGSGIFNDPLTAHSGFWVAGNAFPTGGSCSNFFVDVKFDM